MIALAPQIAALAVLAAAVLWFGHASRWGVVLYALAFAAAGIGAVDVMGVPKPRWSEWRPVGEVLALDYRPGIAIYVWLAGNPPRAYSLPWSEDTAREAQEQTRKGIPLWMDYENQQPVFYPMPQPSDPPKE